MRTARSDKEALVAGGPPTRRAWLFTILQNQYVNSVRRRARQGMYVSDFDEETHQVPRQDKRLELCDLDRALALLPEEQRTVILLVGLEGMA